MQDVATRWNSTYAMMLSIVSQLDAINAVLTMNRVLDLVINPKDEELMRGLLSLLGPAVEVTDILSQELNVSISAVLGCLYGIVDAVESISMNNFSESAREILQSVRDDFVHRMKEWLEISSGRVIYSAAEKLDPRYKQRSFLPNQSVHTIAAFLKSLPSSSSSSTIDNGTTPPSSPASPSITISSDSHFAMTNRLDNNCNSKLEIFVDMMSISEQEVPPSMTQITVHLSGKSSLLH